MAIPTAADFLNDVGKGPNLNLVHRALQDYWATMQAQPTLLQETAALRSVANACKAWIKTKDKKSEMKKGLFGGDTNLFNTKFLNRRTHVASLGENATKDLLALLRDNDLLVPDQRGELIFDVRKFQQKGMRKSHRHQTKALDTAYGHERTSWVDSKKRVAISGSKMHQLPTDTSMAGWSSAQRKAFNKVTTEHGGSLDDWKVLAQIDALGDMKVAYLKKQERLRYMVFIEGGLLVGEDDAPITTTNSFGNETMVLWAMDRYANLFVYDDTPVWKQTKISQVNHSSMNSGNEVICAGMITVRKGVVVDVTNTSGHYKPTKENLAAALKILKDEGLDLSQAEVRAVRPPQPPVEGKMIWQTFKPEDFINSGGLCQPVSEVLGPKP